MAAAFHDLNMLTCLHNGMSSLEAQEKHHEGMKDYAAAEGKCVEVGYKGPHETCCGKSLEV